jgi:hypothetical protein
MIDMKESHKEQEWQEEGREPYGVVLARLTKCRMRCARLEAIIGDMMERGAEGLKEAGE